MAITASIAVTAPGGNNNSTVIIGQPIQMQITLTNNNATGANIQSIDGYSRTTGGSNNLTNGPFAIGNVNVGPNAPVYVPPNGGTLTVTIPVTWFASSSWPYVPVPTVNSSTQNVSVNSNNTYDLGATIYLTDANTPTTAIVVNPTAATITVNTVPLPCAN